MKKNIKIIKKKQFRKVLHLATLDSYLTSDNKIYEQIDRRAIASFLGLVLSNIFVTMKKNDLKNYPLSLD